MPDIKQLRADEDSLKTIGDFFSAYQKLTIYQMQKNRDATINSRIFFSGLVDTFVDLKQDLKRLIKSSDDDQIVSFSTLSKNGKKVSVVISFETKFSTETNRKTLEFFKYRVESANNPNSNDLVIVGITAKRLFKEYFPESQEYTYFDLKEENSSLKKNIPLMKHLLQYEQVDIYNPYYVTLMQQKPEMDTISGDISLSREGIAEEVKKKHFLFEPGKEKILHFFEVQIMSSLFQHKIKEAHLANLGSRISTLQYTQDNLEKEMDKIKMLKIKTLKYKANKKQRNRLSGMRFWTNK